MVMYSHPCLSYISIGMIKHVTKATHKTKLLSEAYIHAVRARTWKQEQLKTYLPIPK